MAYDISTIGDLGGMGCACQGAPELTEAARVRIGDFLPTIVWPSDVDAYKRKLDPDFRATDASVTACAALAEGERKAWADFNRSWRAFSDKPTDVFGSANAFDAAKEFELKLQAWQDLIAKACKLDSPRVTPPAGTDSSAIKWIALAVIVVGVAYVASPLIMGGRKLAR